MKTFSGNLGGKDYEICAFPDFLSYAVPTQAYYTQRTIRKKHFFGPSQLNTNITSVNLESLVEYGENHKNFIVISFLFLSFPSYFN